MRPRLALLASTALSATYPVSLKLIYAADGAPLSPAVITSLRFALMAGGAALVLSESGDPATSEPVSEPAAFWRAAAELGFWACAGAQLNTAGLQQVGVVRGTVLLSTINVFTPTLSALFGTSEAQRRVSPRVWAACALALASTVLALLGDADAAEPMALRLSRGDELMLAAAACYATGQVRLGSLVATHPARRLAAARLQTQALCSLPFLALASSAAAGCGAAWCGAAGAGAAESLGADGWAVSQAARSLGWAAEFSPTQCALLCFSAATAVTGTLLQFEGQRTVPAAAAQPIYASAPLLTALWGFAVLHEPVTGAEALGGLGVCGAAALATIGAPATVARADAAATEHVGGADDA